VPEWIAWTIDALQARDLSRFVYLWSDDNLSADLLFSTEHRASLRKIEGYQGYGRVCCIKGIDGPSFAYTTGAPEEEFEAQLGVLEAYLKTTIDLYGYITLAGPRGIDDRGHVRRLMDRLQVMRSDFLSRLIPLRIEKFSTMIARLDGQRTYALRYQDELVAMWAEELSSRSIRPMWSDL
jgi:hypothetical protein